MKTKNRSLLPKLFTLPLLLCMFIYFSPSFAQQKNRDQIPERYLWNLKDIFSNPEEWQAEIARFRERMPGVLSFKGTLDQSPQQMLNALNTIFSLWRDLDKIYVYAYLNTIQDLRQSGPQAMEQEAGQLYTALSTHLSYLEPEILSIPAEKLASFLNAEPGLEPYRIYIQNILRNKPHRLDAEQEWLISKAALITGVGEKVHNVLTAAELPWRKVSMKDGGEVVINVPGYEQYRTSADPSLRISTFEAFYGSLEAFRGTFAALLNSKVKENLYYRDVRKYESVLDMYLFPRKIPKSVYTGLIESVHQALPILHRYLKLKKRLLGMEEMHYHDLYPEWFPGTDVRYEFSEAQPLLEKSLAILGPEYRSFLHQAFENRWIDVFPSPGKISGASCEGSYDTHPFVKLNYNGRFSDVSMAAHELGHAMHSCFTNKNQPYATAGYNSLIAETAATVNSSLLSAYVIANTKDKKQKLALLGNVMETFRQTLFRQCLFAEFEFRVHEMAESGKSLSADDFDRMYLDLLKTYYGHDQGVVYIDDLYRHEWCYISHYFIGFYHYFYCTSFTAANSIVERLTQNGKPLLKKYLQLLSSGNTIDPIPLLQSVEVDLTSSRPMEDTIRLMNRYLDVAEQIAAELNAEK